MSPRLGGRIVRVLFVAGLLASAIAGCGSGGVSSRQEATSFALGGLGQVRPTSCISSGKGRMSDGVTTTITSESCVYVLSDGQRFRCPGALSRTLRTVSSLEHTKACVQLSKLVVPAAARVVFAAITRAGTCVKAEHLSVTGGPVFHPQGPATERRLYPRPPESDGERHVSDGLDRALIGPRRTPGRASRRGAYVSIA